MNKKSLILGLVFAALISFPLVISAQTTAVTPLTTAQQAQVLQQKLVSLLRQRIEMLQAELVKLQSGTRLSIETVQTVWRLTKPLKKGEEDEEVKLLQGVLATDPELYPERYQTGYFGALTEKALRKFQKKAGLTETGEVDDKTIWKINELLTEGAGRSGKIPPGLLRAPGILKKLGLATTTSPGRDTTAPIITAVSATSTTASTTMIVWQTDELTIGQIYYATTTPVVTAVGQLGTDPEAIWATAHTLTLGNLQSSTTYYYYLRAADRAGNSATTTDASFTTLSQ